MRVPFPCYPVSISLINDPVVPASPLSTLPPPLAESRTPTPQSQGPITHSDQDPNRQVVSRSRWQSVLLEAGGISAAVSEESMRRLKYCLQWLQVGVLHMPTCRTRLKRLSRSMPPYISTLKSSFSAASSTPFNLMLLIRPHQTPIFLQHTCVLSTTFAETS